MIRSHIYKVWNDALPEGNLGTGVSLHSHTSRSRELMSFIPCYVDKVPYMSARIRTLENDYIKYYGKPFDYRRVWWTPPLEPKAAWDLERQQIESKLGRKGLVSLSDHDNVDAGFALELFPECAAAPISSEWTVPIGDSFLHVGIHNLQPARATMLHKAMAEVTADPDPQAVEDLFDELVRDPKTLVILNHPLWDEDRKGQDVHNKMVQDFLKRYQGYIHALELNGLRDWKENSNVIQLGVETNLPVVSGGDRHGCEPNACLNLTSAQNFNDFAEEVRSGAPVHTVFMAQYREPYRLRVLQVMADVLRTYDNFSEERRRWSDRVFFQGEDESVSRLSDVWKGNGPDIIGQFVGVMRLMDVRPVRGALRFAFGTTEPGV